MRLTPHQVLVALSVSVVGGILYGSLYAIPKPWLFMATAFVCVWLGLRASRSLDTIPTRRWFVLVIPWLLLGFCIGAFRIQTALTEPNQYADVIGSKVDLEGLVVGEPDIRSNYQLITVQPNGATQNLLVTMPLSSQYAYGDVVWLRGKVVAPKLFDDFDYPGYLARFNVYGLVRYPKMIVLQQGEGNWLVGNLLILKHVVIKRLLYLFGQEQGRLLLGILIGAKQGLPQEVLNNFSRTGTSHIMAVSGFNISILLVALSWFSYLVGRKFSSVLAVIAVVLFVIIAGPTSSVLRAAGMGVLVILATLGRRLYMPLGALVCVASIMAVLNPRIVYWDVGFQLSSAATVGILVGMPLFEQLSGGRYKIFAPLVVTSAAIICTVPISMWRFGTLSTVALFANVLVVPVVPVVMAFGALSLVPVLGSGFAFICSLLLQFMLWCVSTFARPAWASVQVSLSGTWVFAWFVGLTVCVSAIRWLRGRRALLGKTKEAVVGY